jgi:transcriptional regulator with XRE-family HTH domain
MTSGSLGGGFGRQLRSWRAVRGMSQLDLALAAGTTPRHVSFVETGRSRPGTDLVLRLADVLAVPVRERNALLAAAGLPPAYPEHTLDDEALGSVRRVLDRVLAAHEPLPGWVIGRGLRFLQATAGAERLFPGLIGLEPRQVIEFWFGPGPFRERVANWPDVVRATLTTLRREALLTGDVDVAELAHRAEELARDVPGVPDESADAAGRSPVACPTLILDGEHVRTITTVLRFDTATEVTTSELRVELMFPADDASDLALRRLLGRDHAGDQASR